MSVFLKMSCLLWVGYDIWDYEILIISEFALEGDTMSEGLNKDGDHTLLIVVCR